MAGEVRMNRSPVHTPYGGNHEEGIMVLLRTASAAVIATALLAPGTSFAQTGDTSSASEQDQDRVIVVTATRRETDLQDTALSISAISGRELEARGIDSVAKAISTVPGVSLLNDQPGRADITIRGVNTSSSSISQADVIVNSTTAVYLNQLPVTSTVSKTPDFRFVDMERVEVLRGPQGTLYGQSAMGGVVRYITNTPDSGGIAGGGSTYLSTTDMGGTNFGADAYLNIPVTDELAVRFVGYAYDNSGFIDAVGIENRKNSNDENTYGARAALRWQPSDRVTLDLNYLYHEVTLGNLQAISSTYTPTGVSADNGRPQNFRQASTDRFVAQHLQPTLLRSHVFNGEVLVEFDSFSANLILGRKTNDTSNEFEAAELTGGTESYFNNTTLSDTHSNTAEFRLVSEYDDSLIDWLAGVYYEKAGGTIGTLAVVSGAPRVFIPGVFVLNPGNRVIDSGRQLDYEELAFYGEVGVNFSSALRFTAGYRYSDVQNNYRWTYAQGTFDAALGRTALLAVNQVAQEKVDTFRFNLEYKASEDLLVYGQASSGFRPGGFNPGNAFGPTPIPDFDYQSDSLWNYEIGVRSRFDGIGDLNVVGYHIDWSDIQLPSTQLVAPFYSATLNAGSARIWGLEVEATVRPAEGLDLTVAYAYTDAELTSIAAPIPGLGSPPGRVGEQLPGTAKNMFTGIASWTKPIGSASLSANLIYRHVGSRTSSLGDPTRAPAYDTLDARVAVSMNNGLTATLFAENLTNEAGILRIIQGAPFQTGDRFTYLNVIRPRTVGLRLSISF
jgi:iron complex outermembrane recepter protein